MHHNKSNANTHNHLHYLLVCAFGEDTTHAGNITFLCKPAILRELSAHTHACREFDQQFGQKTTKQKKHIVFQKRCKCNLRKRLIEIRKQIISKNSNARSCVCASGVQWHVAQCDYKDLKSTLRLNRYIYILVSSVATRSRGGCCWGRMTTWSPSSHRTPFRIHPHFDATQLYRG